MGREMGEGGGSGQAGGWDADKRVGCERLADGCHPPGQAGRSDLQVVGCVDGWVVGCRQVGGCARCD